MNTVMIVTGESSGELYGSLLARALKAIQPDVRIIGVGGEKMKEAGVEIISGISSAFGISEAISSYKAIKETFAKTIAAIEKFSPEVVVLIDYPDFNIKVGKIAKEKGAKILYYVSPQVWAWRKGRVKTIAGLSDRIAVILPFEAGIYRDTGTPCEFVGHPILEEIESLEEDRESLKASLGLKNDSPVLALLPGSRSHELKGLLPVMLDVIRDFKKEFSVENYQFIMPVAPNIEVGRYREILDRIENEGVIIKKENAIKVLSVSDLAVIASGTATLQAAFLETPMVVIYKLSPFTYFLGKAIINVRYISLINLISDRKIVKELLQSRANSRNIMSELKKIVRDKDYRERMTGQFRIVRDIFAGKRPSERVAEMIYEIAG
ncbi:MAG: lipid-A-disaccharide synthase [Nitrospirae bacterium]|nr:lipid-A-disaccharide synthase [Nitrospirota bacterium]